MLDMDSTLIEQEVINLLGHAAGQSNEISEITEKAMAGDLDFKTALSQRVALLKGLDQESLNTVRNQITLTKGAKTLIDELHHQGHKVGVVSGGFIEVIEPILKSLRIDFYRANKLKIENGVLTGELDGPLIDSHAKRIALEDFANQEQISLEQTVAIGDGANDLEMIKAAGLGIAFNAKPKVAAAADTTISNQDLSTVLLLMGISI
jgi:phosphoserine phosphatase